MSMEVQLRLPHVWVKVEGANQKELFEQAASAAEVFGESRCGLCQSQRIIPKTRKVDDNTYFEWECLDCHAKLALGQNKKEPTLFPKRRLLKTGHPDMKKGEFGPHNGWSKYRGESRDDD